MTREEIIQGLQFTIDMFLLNPTTGETYTEPRNDMDKTTIDACKGAIKLLREESEKDEVILTKKEYGELVSSEFDNGYAKGFREALEQEPCNDAISRKALIERINKAEDDFKADNMEIIASGGDSFVDGVLSGVFNIREMVIQAQSIYKAESEDLNE